MDLSHQTASLVSSLQTDGVNVEEQKTNAGKAQKNKSRAAGLHERVMRLARECDFDVSAVERISAENALQEKKQAKKSSMKTQTRSEWPADLVLLVLSDTFLVHPRHFMVQGGKRLFSHLLLGRHIHRVRHHSRADAEAPDR